MTKLIHLRERESTFVSLVIKAVLVITDIKSHRASRAEWPDTKVCAHSPLCMCVCVCLYCTWFRVSSLCHESKTIKGDCVSESSCVWGGGVCEGKRCQIMCVIIMCQTDHAVNQSAKVQVALPLVTQSAFIHLFLTNGSLLFLSVPFNSSHEDLKWC